MTPLVENTTGVALRPLLFDDLTPGWDDEIDVVATPVFHLADFAELSYDLDRVVELNFIPPRSVLRQLAMIPPSAIAAVAAPTRRGVERMRAMVSQYYAGPILTPDPGNDAPFDGIDVLVHPGAITIDPETLAGVRREIVIDWELDPGSAATFAGRVAATMGR